MTEHLFERANEGDKIEIKGPLGKFTLPDEIDGDLLFICTGTGLALLEVFYKVFYYKIFLIKIFI